MAKQGDGRATATERPESLRAERRTENMRAIRETENTKRGAAALPEAGASSLESDLEKIKLRLALVEWECPYCGARSPRITRTDGRVRYVRCRCGHNDKLAL